MGELTNTYQYALITNVLEDDASGEGQTLGGEPLPADPDDPSKKEPRWQVSQGAMRLSSGAILSGTPGL
jgi:hypothetical protein